MSNIYNAASKHLEETLLAHRCGQRLPISRRPHFDTLKQVIYNRVPSNVATKGPKQDITSLVVW